MGLEVEAWKLGEVRTCRRLGILGASFRLGLMKKFAIRVRTSPASCKLTADAVGRMLGTCSQLNLMEIFAIREGTSPAGHKLTADAVKIH